MPRVVQSSHMPRRLGKIWLGISGGKKYQIKPVGYCLVSISPAANGRSFLQRFSELKLVSKPDIPARRLQEIGFSLRMMIFGNMFQFNKEFEDYFCNP